MSSPGAAAMYRLGSEPQTNSAQHAVDNNIEEDSVILRHMRCMYCLGVLSGLR